MAALHRGCNLLLSPRRHSVVRPCMHETSCQRHAPMLCSSTPDTPAPMNIPSTVVARCRRPASPSQLDVVASCKKARCSMASPGPNKPSCPLQLSVSLVPANHLPYPSKKNLSHKKSRWLVATKVLAGPSKNERRLQQKNGHHRVVAKILAGHLS